MKSMVVLSMLVAGAVSQVLPYAPAFGYNGFRARTALDVFEPTLHQPTIFYSNPAFAYNNLYPTVAASAPAHVVASPAAAVLTKSTVDQSGQVTVEEEVEEGPLTLRAIFPIFASDLRAGGAEELIFLRPDQVAPIQAVTEIQLEDAPEDNANNAGVIVPDFSFRSAPALAHPDFRFRSAPVFNPYFNQPYAALPFPSLFPTQVKTE